MNVHKRPKFFTKHKIKQHNLKVCQNNFYCTWVIHSIKRKKKLIIISNTKNNFLLFYPFTINLDSFLVVECIRQCLSPLPLIIFILIQVKEVIFQSTPKHMNNINNNT